MSLSNQIISNKKLKKKCNGLDNRFVKEREVRILVSSSLVGRVVRGGFWLYLSGLVNNLQGFIYWLVISWIAGGSVLGLTSTTVGIASVISGLLGLGLGVGVQRFLGACYSRRDYDCLSDYFWSTTTFAILIRLIVGALLIIVSFFTPNLGSYNPLMLRLAGIIVIASSSGGFIPLYQSLLQTRIIFLTNIIGAILKLLIGIGLVYLGFGWVGATIGYLSIPLAGWILYPYYTKKIVGFRLYIRWKRLKEVLIAGIPSWFPGLIVLLGQWLGVLVVFGTQGALETGYYFIAFAIASVVLMVSNSLLGLLLPVLSGMEDGRKRAGVRVLRISLAGITPISVFLIVYPGLVLGLLGRDFLSANNILRVLLLGSIPIAFTSFMNSLLYAYGYYRRILLLGLSQNIPRLALYFLLVPVFAGLGAAESFTIGSLTGGVYALLVSRKLGVRYDTNKLLITIGVPGFIGLFLWFFSIHWLIGLLLIVLSYIVYVKAGVITRMDLKEISTALLGYERVMRLYEKLKPFLEPILS